jgi:hypothetical protein
VRSADAYPVRAVPQLPVPRATSDARSFRNGPKPLQSPYSTFPLSAPSAGPASREVFATFNGILARAPYGKGRPKPNPVPLSGFLNLSAASQQTRVPRPYFMPQPFLIASFRVFPSQRSRAPLEAASFPVVIHRRLTTRHSRPYCLRFLRRPRPRAQLPGSPEDYELPFDEPKPASRSPWTPSNGTVMPRRLHPLRSLDPPASPFTPARANPNQRPILS